MRDFDPVRLGNAETDAWAYYYRHEWAKVLRAFLTMIRVGFGLSWPNTVRGAWWVLRANQLWAPYPDNDPEGARRCMRRFYALVRLTYGAPANPAKAAELEVNWWRVHRESQHREGSHAIDDAEPDEELVESLTRLYCHLYSEPEAAIRPAAMHRARAMDLSDQWVREGCQPDSRLLPLEHAALVRCYAALLAAVHR